jgi:alpha-galactosidase
MSVTYNSETKTFMLQGKNLCYSFWINDLGYPEHLYLGASVGNDDLRFTRTYGATSTAATPPGIDNVNSYNAFPSELSFFGTGDYREPAVQIVTPQGDRLCELLFDSYEIVPAKPKITGMPSLDGGETLILHLKDKINGFAADLYYTVYDDCSVICRRAVYKNCGSADVRLERAYSFTLALPDRDYDMISLYGVWAKERHIDRIPLHHGVVSIDSKRTSSSATLNPFIALLRRDTTEFYGEAIGVNLVYSSSYVLKAEVNPDGTSQITGGINDFDFNWNLAPGEVFETPDVVISYSDTGLGGMSRAFHDAYREHLINRRYVKASRPLLINNWEATYFNFDVPKLCAIADAVNGLGIDTLVLDDGWFGKRDNDYSGLGDWVVNDKKLQGGVKAISDYVHSIGMKFGLWFEPEMVSEDSDLYRAHPDWAIGTPDRKHCYSRHQFMLDLTRREVRDYIVKSVSDIIENNGVDYVKWDYNRNVTESWTYSLEPERQMEFAHRYALGLYDICERIVNGHPDIFFEGCSAGGARFDPAIMHYFPQIWTSDDTDAEERTKIQFGTSLVYPLSVMSCHVSVCPNHQTGRTTPFDTRAIIAHLGATGYELDTTKFTDEEKAAVKLQTAEYKKIERLILDGDLYRIDSPFEKGFFTEAVVAKDKSFAELVCYRRFVSVNNEVRRVKMVGLDPEAYYCLEEKNIKAKGSTFMNVGFSPDYPHGDFSAVKYHFTRI